MILCDIIKKVALIKIKDETNMTLKEYMRELWLMEKQYGMEEELYPFINMLLRESGSVENLSVRTVANRRTDGKSEGNKLLYGYAGFPDIAILDEDFLPDKEDSMSKIYGCVEAKHRGKELCKMFDENIMSFNNISQLFRIKISFTEKGTPRPKYYQMFKGNVDVQTKQRREKISIKVNENSEPIELELGNYKTIEENICKIFIKMSDKEDLEINKFISYTSEGEKEIPDNEKPGFFRIKVERCVDGIIKLQNVREKDNTEFSLRDENVRQLFGELLWYGKVLYTNGIEWKYIELTEIIDTSNESKKENVSIVELRKKLYEECVKDRTSEWYNMMEKIHLKTSCKVIGNLKDIDKKNIPSEDDYAAWSTFKANLAAIKWQS